MTPSDEALLALGRRLRELRHRFVTITPASHAIVLSRGDEARTLRDVFGWSKWFLPSLLPPDVLELMRIADVLEEREGRMRSRVRWSSIGDALFVHSAFPTTEPDSVFFGPDTYRFASFLERVLTGGARARCMVEIGCGTGAGAIVAANAAERVVLADINPRALRFAAINARLAGLAVETIHSDVLQSVGGEIDLVVSNPPYLVDEDARLYRDGGGALGLSLSLRIVEESLQRLSPGGRLVLYTATPILEGADPLRAALEKHRARCDRFDYGEIDPDVFGEELGRPAYAAADRIAVVSLVATRA